MTFLILGTPIVVATFFLVGASVVVHHLLCEVRSDRSE